MCFRLDVVTHKSLFVNVVLYYTVACSAIQQYNIYSEEIGCHLRFVTTAMHAYGHEWACQLVYNPHLSVGLGLSDGEGTEWLWSRLIKLIGIERSFSVSSLTSGYDMYHDTMTDMTSSVNTALG